MEAIGGGGGVQQWGGCRQPIRSALHNIRIGLQNSLS